MKAEQEIRKALTELGFELVESNLYKMHTDVFEISVCLDKGLIVTVMLYSLKSVYTKKQTFSELEVAYLRIPYKSFIENVIMKSVEQISKDYIFMKRHTRLAELSHKQMGGKNKTELWIARDKDNSLFLYDNKPIRENDDFSCHGNYYEIDSNLFTGVTWENSPRKIKIELT